MAKHVKPYREDAAVICSALACNGGWGRTNSIEATRWIMGAYGRHEERVRGFVLQAFEAVEAVLGHHTEPEDAAEAEALIRTGWTPRSARRKAGR